MKYTAPNGFIIKSKPYPEEVVYECPCSGIVDGRFASMETTGANTDIGIQQIRILRSVENNNMIITIRESSDFELIEYQNNPNL